MTSNSCEADNDECDDVDIVDSCSKSKGDFDVLSGEFVRFEHVLLESYTTTYPSIGSNAIERGISSSSSIKTLPILPSKLVNSMVPLQSRSDNIDILRTLHVTNLDGKKDKTFIMWFAMHKTMYQTHFARCSSSPPGQSASPSHNQSKLMHVMRSLHWNSKRKQGFIDCVRFKQP
uniref:Uncharacterized protein n=1 Tax=Glossina palpalis gambiensis TaxID=67801 RepID=A0A1B0C2C3_9MUSC